jgi:Spy/CpxP family protein refolding chaperone
MKTRAHLATLTLTVVATLAVSAVAQPPGGRGGRGFGGPGGPFGGGIIGLMQSDEVRQEIELSEDQEAELRTLRETVQDEIRNEMGDMFRGMRDLSDEERQARFDEIRTRFDEINKDVEGRLGKVLLPHQFDRVKQIDLQSRIQRGGASALSEGELAETLGLTEGQREQLREKSEEVERDLNAKIQQLRLDARNQLLEVLTTEQRAKLEGMMGEAFAVPEPQFGPGRGGRLGGDGGRRGRGDRNRGGNQEAAAAAE